MKFTSTRNAKLSHSLETAITHGLAPDGGLYVPCQFPQLEIVPFYKINSYPEFAYQLLHDFFAGSVLKPHLLQFCQNAFNFPLPISSLNSTTHLMELFHGPTLSFKDFGARFLAECVNALSEETKRVVLVATSGDTGSAVASAFHDKANIRVIVLFPKGKVTERQRRQIACWDNNVYAVALATRFDECQTLVKKAFLEPSWQEFNPTSANSINLGRLLPQLVYYAYTSVYFSKKTQSANFIVPSGNLGNVVAAYWARALGFPIDRIAIACNANHVVTDYLTTGKFTPHPSIATLANAMDVGEPSNFERLTHLYPTFNEFTNNVMAISVSDEHIKQSIREVYEKYKILICPHTATGYYYRQQLPEEENWIIAATADPCKFENTIEPLLDVQVPIPDRLALQLKRQEFLYECEPNLAELKVLLQGTAPSVRKLTEAT